MGDRKNFLPLFHRRASEQRERNCSGGSVESRRSAGAGRRVFARSCVRQLGRNETHRNDEPTIEFGRRVPCIVAERLPNPESNASWRADLANENNGSRAGTSASAEPSSVRTKDRVHWTATAMYVAKTDSRSGSLEYNKVPVVSGVKLLRSTEGDLSRLCHSGASSLD
jgi:hypothetical protein